MYSARICIHPLMPNATNGQHVTVGGRSVDALSVSGSPPSFAVTFDAVSEILSTLPGMFLEPDGSFAWTGTSGEQPWRIEGVLYDAGPSLSYVALSGNCPPDEFDQFLAALGWPAAPIMFQLIDAGVFINEEEFRRFASGD